MCKIKKMVLFVVAFFAIQSIATAQQMNVEMKNGETEVFSIADVNKITWTQSGQGLSKDSPVGTVGMLYGREAIVVDLGGSIGKVGIATQNDGASSGNIYGDYMKYDDACAKYENRTDGWHLPSQDELQAVVNLVYDGESYIGWDNSAQGLRINFASAGTSLFFPATGYIEDNTLHEVGTSGNYWSKDEVSGGFAWDIDFDCDNAWLGQHSKPKGYPVRPFCTLPDQPVAPSALNKQSPEGTIGILYGREAMVVDLGGTIGKVAISTMNLGASNPKEYGILISSEYAFRVSAYNMLGQNWRLPTVLEARALIDKGMHYVESEKGAILELSNNVTLYFVAAGFFNNQEWGGYDETCCWWIYDSENDVMASMQVCQVINEIGPDDPDQGFAFRPFCDLPDF